ncbi:hypothetical protein CCZ01_08905 [Helicobacter monodelphidis]|uniref:DEAD/DEAH box helicase family protein n=1 Tax=Helicobacter sp. 15-1451 TaxID=2004995 RepID=UPI000DCEB2BC|nr:DEAD/DEAH box helicase family protein [Helicobacter sp. 15-1451]RAX56646.1 hypothetical protein CCZ01_08905 [Helicobacter sp. 15-1451]
MTKTKVTKATPNKLILNEIINELQSEYKDIYNLDSSFALNISLQDYQQAALQNALIALKLYMQDFQDSHQNFSNKRGEVLFHKYLDKQGYEKALKKDSINRASFWMATGSGKTIVMIRLIALLDFLAKSGIFPKKPIMLLAPNDKILSQFKQNIELYNNYQSKGITIKELREFESVSVESKLFDEAIIYIARSDLLDTSENVGKDSKARRLNYKNFLNKEGWYILLDEAHRGDSKDSMRKRYIYELSKGLESSEQNSEYPRGFIFNFSATFDEKIDFDTCAFNYNLEKFNREGYGKNIALLDSNLASFKDKENESEKIERIMESFIIFYAIKQSQKKLVESSPMQLNYHNPLIIAVSDKVNTKEAGIKLYFEAIIKILSNDMDITSIAQNLESKLRNLDMYFDSETLSEAFLAMIKNADSKALRKSIFYANEIANIEACKIRGNDKELAFKSKNASQPFMLLNIGNAKEWEKEYLATLGVESGEDITKGYFEHINEPHSPINIMMGSKIFSEGWDSNRVNLICFINIGSKNAKKYVLQTIGRGVRIEPFKNIRKRLEKCDSQSLDHRTRENLAPYACGLESLFVMASDENAIKTILEGIESFVSTSAIKGFKLSNALKPLPVPKYTEEAEQGRIYHISHRDSEALKAYIESFDEDVLLLSENLRRADMGYASLKEIQILYKKGESKRIAKSGDKASLKVENALRVIDSFFHASAKKLERFGDLSNEICHYKYMQSTLDSNIIDEMNAKIKELVKAKRSETKEELESLVNAGKMGIKEALEIAQQRSPQNLKVPIYNGIYELNAELEKHYYNPIIVDKQKDGKINYAIQNASEIEFLKDLQQYVAKKDNILQGYEWCFSRLVENIDNIFIPYFDEERQEMRRFYPDFVFWLKSKRDSMYHIIFIDPKGLKYEANARDKASGFERIFAGQNLRYNECEIKVDLVYYNKGGASGLGEELKRYAKARCEEIFAT